MPRILVADDNNNIQKMVALAFEERGVEVIAVGNGEAAVRRMPDANPDLVLADVFMPVRNGYEVCEFIKKDERFAHIPVILLVGAFDPLDEREARRVGADGVLKKPFVPPDPLIAMVMSALEKNPKLAAALAKARELPPEPPAPPPVALEIPVKAEPKPLPEFPEPTPEEAAAIYGFGKGVRSLDEIDEKAAKESKAPVLKAKEEPEGEEFDGASTSSDWRRTTGMDLDIPDASAGGPSFSTEQDFSPASFPSERDCPPKHIRVEAEPEEEEAIAHNAVPAAEFMEQPAHQGEAKQESRPEPAATKHSSGWMDMMAPPPPPEYPEGSWMTESAAPRAEDAQKSEQASVAAPAPTSSRPGHEEASTSSRSDEKHARPMTRVWQAPPEETTPLPAASDSEAEVEASSEDRPKKKSWFADAVEAVREVVHGVVQETSKEEFHEPAHEQVPEPVSSSATDISGTSHTSSAPETSPVSEVDSSHELISAPADFRPSRRDPELEEPPAVHGKREPLLVNEEPSGPSGYGKRQEMPAPAHSFLPPPPPEPTPSRIFEQFPSEKASANSESSFATSNSFNERASDESESDLYSERIPTLPPPNREALAEIPFLSPPPAAMDSGKVSGETVDAVVKKVLEQLEPQLHEMLSKGLLKPLVENMLQTELAKKK